MKRFKVGLALVAALITMSFTIASRTSILDEIVPYVPGDPCWEAFSIPADPEILNTETQPTINLPAICGNDPDDVEVIATGTKLSNFANVTPAGRKVILCSDEVDFVCCFHIDEQNDVILDVCIGRPLQYEED